MGEFQPLLLGKEFRELDHQCLSAAMGILTLQTHSEALVFSPDALLDNQGSNTTGSVAMIKSCLLSV